MDEQPEATARPTFAAAGTVRYEEALGAIEDHFAILDREFRYVFVNAKAAETLGRPAEELIGNRIWDLFPAAVGNQFYQELHRAASERVPIHSEHYYEPFDRWFVNHIYPYADGLCVFTTDITDLKRAQQERERLFALLETVARQMPAALLIADAESGKVVFSNRQVARITGYEYGPGDDVEAGPSLHDFELYRPNGDILAAEEWPVTRALRAGETIRDEEILLRRTDGARIAIEANAGPVRDRDGKIVAGVVVFQDVTERKEAEVALREADRRKDEFLAMLAHELRNPLAPILHAVNALRQLEPGSSKAEWCQEVIERQVLHLSRLVDDLLDISRITQGKVKLQKERVDLHSVITRAVETVRPFVESRRHELVLDLPAEPMVLEGDLMRLAQVVANLLHNAAKYTQNGGRIELGAERQNGEMVLRVRDNGIGIPDEMLGRIFDLFTQVDRSLSRSEGGLGVGLTLVRSLVTMHDGSVAARSEGPGQGTELEIRLPASVHMEELMETAPENPAPPASRKVLVVDDNADSAESLAMILSLRGHEARTALDGQEALAVAREFRPEVVMLDIGLPGMDGYEVARRLRADYDGILLVALTGYGQDEDRRRSKEAGFDHHLVKPVDFEVLQGVMG
jgi:PAS domain S-box-containing protein